MSVLAILGAILTIVGPALTPVLLMWAEKAKAKREAERKDVIDAHIRQHLEGNHAGLLNLSVELERLHQEAQRKRAHRPQRKP